MPRVVEPQGVEGRTVTRVRYTETDRMGVAHHSHFLAWFELGRTELMRERGCPYGELEDREGVFFPVIHATAAYRAPARYDEQLSIATRIASVRGARIVFEYEISRAADGTVLATGSTEHAAVDARGRPRRMPAELRRKLEGLDA